VVEMKHEEHYAQVRSELGERAQQRHRVSAAADGHTDAFTGTDQAVLA